MNDDTMTRNSNSDSNTALRDNAEVVWQVPVAVAVLSLFYAVIGIAIAPGINRVVQAAGGGAFPFGLAG